jgi:hypothetical protein
MPSVQVRNMPDKLYNKLVELAKKDNRSIAKETIYLLGKAIDLESDLKSKRVEKIENILRLNEKSAKYKLPPAVDMIREDRDR